MANVIAHPLTPVVLFSAANALAYCVLIDARISASPGMAMVLQYGWVIVLLLWMDSDARRLRRTPCYDFGFLAAVLFPLSLLWFCFWSRGWRGMLQLLLLVALWLVPYVVATVFWFMLNHA